jgi:hypothetical protein
MGFNHKAAGHPTLEGFIAAMFPSHFTVVGPLEVWADFPTFG